MRAMLSMIGGALLAAPVLAQAPAYLVADLNTHPAHAVSSFPGDFAMLGGRAYFAATDAPHGRELWRTDGTTAGTELVADLNPGDGGSQPTDLTVVEESLWFFAWDDRRGCGVWRSDGRPEGTALVAVLHADRDQCRARSWPGFAALGDGVVFSAVGPEGRELWGSDGTAAGTRLIADIRAGLLGSQPTNLTSAGDVVFFVADDGVHGSEVWRSDGTLRGTVLVRDTFPGPDSGLYPRSGAFAPPRLAVVRGGLVFAADSPEYGPTLWRSDGTASGTAPLPDATSGEPLPGLAFRDGSLSPVVSLGDGLAAVFGVDAGSTPGRLRVWRTDGTAEGTTPWAGLPYNHATTDGLPPGPVARLGAGLALGLTATNGTAIWRLDGATEPSRVMAPGNSIGALVAVGDHLFFNALVPGRGCGLWGSDGTQEGTVALTDGTGAGSVCPTSQALEPPALRVAAVAERIVFAHVTPSSGVELHGSDGTAPGTGLVRNINDETGRTSGTGFRPHASVGRLLFFSTLADPQPIPVDLTNAPEGLWRSDGTAAGTLRLSSRTVFHGGAVGDRFVFDANGNLWSSDGTADGTTMILPGGRLYGPPLSTPAGLFLGLGDAAGRGLWISDGTSAGTARLAAFPPLAYVSHAVALDEGALFVVYLGQYDELWFSDGTSAGTTRIATLAGSRVRSLAAQNGLAFATVGPSPGGPFSALWRSDGTASGTRLVVDLDARSLRTSILWLTPGPAHLFLGAIDGTAGLEPWRSDGTASGTVPLGDLRPSADSSLPAQPRAAIAGNGLVFLADDGVHGLEPWRSDGSPSGTTLLRDIDARHPAAITDTLDPAMLQVGDRVVFAPRDPDAGVEPWVTDGTPAGTRRLADIAPGPRSGLRTGAPFATSATHVLFAADDGRSGQELWAIPRAALRGADCAGDCDADGRVAIADLVRGVGIALGAEAECDGLDRDADGRISIDELVTAVTAALDGC